MQALVYEGPRAMHVRDVPLPAPALDDALVRVAFSGICGSELSGYLGQNALRRPPLIFGHEFSGTIAALGERAAASGRLAIGQRVTANPLVSCLRCRQCLRGRQQLCVDRKLLSASLPGSNAEYVLVPGVQVHPLPDHLTLEEGALAEPVACAARVSELAAPQPHEVALIVGMGPIGLLVLRALRLHGVATVIASDLNHERLTLARALGAVAVDPREQDLAEVIRQHTAGQGADLAVDAVGATATRLQCVQGVAPGGRVIFTGLHEAESPLPVNTLIRSEISCFGAFAYSAANFATGLQWLAEGRIGLPAGVVVAPLAEGPVWFERLLQHDAAVAKVLLVPGSSNAQ